MKFRFPIVVVTWLDACTHSDGEGNPRHEPTRQVTVGWLLRRDRSGVSIASEYNDDHSGWRDEHFIPAGMIESVTRRQ